MSRAIQMALVAGGVFLLGLPGRGDAASPHPPRLFYLEPAREWTEALPVGNGRVGGVVFGGVAEERILGEW